MKRFLFFTVVVVFMLALSVCASAKLSPAIDVIANDFSMVKSTVANDGEFIFDINESVNSESVSPSNFNILAISAYLSSQLILLY